MFFNLPKILMFFNSCLCLKVHHTLLVPIKSQTNLQLLLDFEMGQPEMRHNTFVNHRDIK